VARSGSLTSRLVGVPGVTGRAGVSVGSDGWAQEEEEAGRSLGWNPAGIAKSSGFKELRAFVRI
jgi:hypothetical protein